MLNATVTTSVASTKRPHALLSWWACSSPTPPRPRAAPPQAIPSAADYYYPFVNLINRFLPATAELQPLAEACFIFELVYRLFSASRLIFTPFPKFISFYLLSFLRQPNKIPEFLRRIR